jgi:hypothetical protein
MARVADVLVQINDGNQNFMTIRVAFDTTKNKDLMKRGKRKKRKKRKKKGK